jgi:hypothetical protein
MEAEKWDMDGEPKDERNQSQQSNGTSKSKWKEKEREDSKEGYLQPRNTVSHMDCQRTTIRGAR